MFEFFQKAVIFLQRIFVINKKNRFFYLNKVFRRYDKSDLI